MQVVSFNHTCEEKGLLGKPSWVGADEISTGYAHREQYRGYARKIVKFKLKNYEIEFRMNFAKSEKIILTLQLY